MILFGVAMAVLAVLFAVAMPLLPFVLIALAVWAFTRHSRAATAYLNS